MSVLETYCKYRCDGWSLLLVEKERDEYMRNPCDQARSKFFIVELCETIHATKIELANFELFSSGPKDVRVSASERYPTTEWTPIGDFVAQDARNIQSFPVIASRSYAKFLKVLYWTFFAILWLVSFILQFSRFP